MDREEAIRLLKSGREGVEEWNRRKADGERIPRLDRANLNSAKLCWVNDDALVAPLVLGPDIEDCVVDLEDTYLVGADLKNACLFHARFKKAMLSFAYLNNTDLRGARLENANLGFARLQNGNFEGARLQDANLLAAHLEKANLCFARLENASLLSATLQEAMLKGAQLENANLSLAHLEGTNLEGACFKNANLLGAHLEKAELLDTHLDGANLRGVGTGHYRLPLLVGRIAFTTMRIGWYYWRRRPGIAKVWRSLTSQVAVLIPFRLNSTHVRGTRFSPNVNDPWSALRRNYAGARMAFRLLFLVAFLIPYVAKTVFWVGVNRMEQRAVRATVAVIEKTSDRWLDSPNEEKRASANRAKQWLKNWGEKLLDNALGGRVEDARECWRELRAWAEGAARLVEDEDFQAQDAIAQGRRLAELLGDVEFRERSVWQLVLGFDQGLFCFLLVAVLVVYNGACGYLTYRVGALREAEERSDVTPRWSEYRGLFFYGHIPVAMLFYVAAVSFGVNLFHWMTLPVLLPY